MAHLLSHPSSGPLVDRLRDAFFSHPEVFYSPTAHLSFICGASRKSGLRSRYQTYIDAKRIPPIRYCRAEDALEYLISESPRFYDLAKFETRIASLFDSVLIFPESAGSLAELGLFSGTPSVAAKCLVVIEIAHQADSFVLLGPVYAIDQISNFKPSLVIDPKRPRFLQITRKLLRFTGKRFSRKRRVAEKYLSMDDKSRLASLLELIYFLGLSTREELDVACQLVFDKPKEEDLDWLLAVLVAARFVRRTGGAHQYFEVDAFRRPTLLEFDHFDRPGLRSAWLSLIHSKFSERIRPRIQRQLRA